MMAGLVLGKFHPLHRGHLGLIDFGLNHCDRLYILICASQTESISGDIRLQWVKAAYANNPRAVPVLLHYDEQELPNTSVSSKEVSKIWADKIRQIMPVPIDIVFSSEPYGDYLAGFLQCHHRSYDSGREKAPISASQILSNPLFYWDYLSKPAQPFFVKKICICGSESTGKTTITERLAQHYQTVFVPEAGREIIPRTEICTPELLQETAFRHAQMIEEKQKLANRLLFSDTDVNTTRSYSRYLFGTDLSTTDYIEEANRFDLWLYLGPDAPFVQDGTRLDRERRNELDLFHQNTLNARGIAFDTITGSWEERFERAVILINQRFLTFSKTTDHSATTK
ncbi:MAG: AAA family ATPase [Bacteroidia bacterium]